MDFRLSDNAYIQWTLFDGQYYNDLKHVNKYVKGDFYPMTNDDWSIVISDVHDKIAITNARYNIYFTIDGPITVKKLLNEIYNYYKYNIKENIFRAMILDTIRVSPDKKIISIQWGC